MDNQTIYIYILISRFTSGVLEKNNPTLPVICKVHMEKISNKSKFNEKYSNQKNIQQFYRKFSKLNIYLKHILLKWIKHSITTWLNF
ncbi:hypothetical protein EO93_09175 [Methanosarcina sp. 1.H.A.2.2]|nr:hypothetical protein EO93_09175 [Methanosarcina sp. 1.H.A.2.2]